MHDKEQTVRLNVKMKPEHKGVKTRGSGSDELKAKLLNILGVNI